MEKEIPQHKPEQEQPESPPEQRKELPLVSIPNDQEMIAQEMAEVFEEDQVTHQHGSTEPEAD